MKAEIQIIVKHSQHPYSKYYPSYGEVWFISPNGNRIYAKFYFESKKLTIFPNKEKGKVLHEDTFKVEESLNDIDVEKIAVYVHQYRVAQGWEKS